MRRTAPGAPTAVEETLLQVMGKKYALVSETES